MRDLSNTPYGQFIWFIGFAEDIFGDPSELGRVRVRAIGFHPSSEVLPTEKLPLAPVLNGGVARINPGQMVLGFFMDGADAQQPFILGVINGGVSSAYNPATAAVNMLEGSFQAIGSAFGSLAEAIQRPIDGSCPQPKEGLVNTAAAWLGYHERKDTACLMELFKSARSGINPSNTPWCGAFVGSILSTQGYPFPSAVNSSRAYASPKYNIHSTSRGYGTVIWERGSKDSKLDEANIQIGDVAVFSRGPISSGKGHVAFVAATGLSGNRITVIGGNQSDSVTIIRKPVSELLSVTRPPNKRPETFDASGKTVSKSGSTS